MRVMALQLVFSLFAILCASALGQDTAGRDAAGRGGVQSTQAAAALSAPQIIDATGTASAATSEPTLLNSDSPAVQILRSFKDSDIKFDLRDLMETLRDRRHEGWVLAAYPDPKTSRPLIGAGFTLDLPERLHAQSDLLNPHPFLEPSSADLWRAAGLDPGRLDAILDQYSVRFALWKKKRFRQRIPALAPQITNDEATLLLRISAIQAVYNAKAYCRNFDRMTGPQQMALSQLVYQIGVNLVRFDDFLSQLNDRAPASAEAAADNFASDSGYWRSVQHTLMQTQWARLYRTRAIAVIAMLDPSYDESPAAAEHLVGASLRPAVLHRRRSHGASLSPVSSRSGNARAGNHTKKTRARAKRRA